MDWGKGNLLTIIGFRGLIDPLVVISVRMDDWLVTENYYQAEIITQIDRSGNPRR